jgi:hypothetical protein
MKTIHTIVKRNKVGVLFVMSSPIQEIPSLCQGSLCSSNIICEQEEGRTFYKTIVTTRGRYCWFWFVYYPSKTPTVMGWSKAVIACSNIAWGKNICPPFPFLVKGLEFYWSHTNENISGCSNGLFAEIISTFLYVGKGTFGTLCISRDFDRREVKRKCEFKRVT